MMNPFSSITFIIVQTITIVWEALQPGIVTATIKPPSFVLDRSVAVVVAWMPSFASIEWTIVAAAA